MRGNAVRPRSQRREGDAAASGAQVTGDRPPRRDELIRAVVATGRAISRDLGAGRGGVALSEL